MAENQPFSYADAIREARQRLAPELRAQAEQIRKLNLELTGLQQLHERIEQDAARHWNEITRAAELADAEAAEAKAAPEKALEDVLGAVRGLMTCTIPEQVFEFLTEEASQWGVRAAVFDVRGKAAWGASAHGFGPALSEKVLRTLIIPLNQNNPFRQVCETAGHVEASADTLKKNRNLLDKLKPPSHAPVLLLPIRSAGTVAAIFYADPGEEDKPLPVTALKILAEFAGAQIDRLIALSGGFAAEEVEKEVAQVAPPAEKTHVEVAVEEPAPAAPHAEEPAVEKPLVQETAVDARAEVVVVEPAAPEPAPPAPGSEPRLSEPEPPAPEPQLLAPPAEVAAEPSESVAPVVEGEPAPPIVEPPVESVSPPPPIEVPPPVTVTVSALLPPAPAGFDPSQLSEAEQKVHKDAKRFAKLLVSEIELYNKTKVADGRKNRDLYKRLKSDIDRSRQTFEKRFGKALSKQFDYFHDELVKTLAANDSAVLGPGYPGPSA